MKAQLFCQVIHAFQHSFIQWYTEHREEDTPYPPYSQWKLRFHFSLPFTPPTCHESNISGGKAVTHLRGVGPWLGGSGPPCAILDQHLCDCPHIPETREKAAKRSCHAKDSWLALRVSTCHAGFTIYRRLLAYWRVTQPSRIIHSLQNKNNSMESCYVYQGLGTFSWKQTI